MTTPYLPFDPDSDKSLKIWEFPLNWMDRTYSKYDFKTIEQITRSFEQLLDTFDEFGGLLTLLWHNYSVSDFGFTDYERLYEQILNVLSSRGFYNDKPGEVIKWMMANKQASIKSVKEDKCEINSKYGNLLIDMKLSSAVRIDIQQGNVSL